METVSRSGLLLWDRTALKSVRSGPVPVLWSGPASLLQPIRCVGSDSFLISHLELPVWYYPASEASLPYALGLASFGRFRYQAVGLLVTKLSIYQLPNH